MKTKLFLFAMVFIGSISIASAQYVNEVPISDIDAEVFVVDNNSVDGSCQMVHKKFPFVTLIENKVNTGFSPGLMSVLFVDGVSLNHL